MKYINFPTTEKIELKENSILRFGASDFSFDRKVYDNVFEIIGDQETCGRC